MAVGWNVPLVLDRVGLHQFLLRPAEPTVSKEWENEISKSENEATLNGTSAVLAVRADGGVVRTGSSCSVRC